MGSLFSTISSAQKRGDPRRGAGTRLNLSRIRQAIAAFCARAMGMVAVSRSFWFSIKTRARIALGVGRNRAGKMV